MDKHALIQSTIPFAAENIRRSWMHLVLTIALIVAAYSGTVVFANPFLRACSSLLAALAMTRMFVIYHDYQHGAIFRKSEVMRVFFRMFGVLALAPKSIWDESHEHHHHNNSKFSTFVVGSFPVVSVDTFRQLSKAGRIKYKVLRHPAMIAFAYIPIFLVSFCLWPFFENPKKYFDCGVAAVLHIAIGLAIYLYGGSGMLVYVILLPSLVMYALGGYLFYAQHNFPTVYFHDTSQWDYLGAALNSSSYIRMNPVMHWFTANIGYHHVHHVNERIPFYRLPEAMNKIAALQSPRETSLRPGEIIRCLKLKLWDAQRGRMISFDEV